MTRLLRIHILGHTGCSKCDAMRKRVANIMEQDPYRTHLHVFWHDSERHDFDSKEDGERLAEDLLWFCKCGEANVHQNVPILVVSDENGKYLPQTPALANVLGANALLALMGLKTNYRKEEGGNGVVTPAQIKAVLDCAVDNSNKDKE